VLRRSTVLMVLTGPFLITALLAGIPCHAGDTTRVVYEPAPEKKGAPELHGETWVQEGELYAIRLQKLDDAERQAYIERVTGLATDPFATKPGHDPRFVSFLLEIENRSDGSINLNPFNCWLMPSNAKVKNPIGITDLSFSYHVAGADLPPAYEKVGEVLIDHPRAIKAGWSFHGLLVYHVVEPNPRSYHVDVQLTLPDGKLARFSAPYRKVKIKKKNRKQPEGEE